MNDFWNKVLPGSVKTDHGKFNATDLLIIVVTVILFGFTCFRTYRFLQATFAGPDTSGLFTLMSIIGLIGLDVATIVWAVTWMFGSTSKWQDIVAIVMFVISIVGMVLTSMTDTLRGENSVPDVLRISAIYGVPAIIMVNVVAFICYHMISPQVSLRRKTRRMHADILETQRLGEIAQQDTAMKLDLAEAQAKQNDELIARQQRLAEQKMTLDGIRLGIDRAMSNDDVVKRKGQAVQEQITANVVPQATLAATAPALPPQSEAIPAPAPQPIPVLVARKTNANNWALLPPPTSDEEAIDLLKRFPVNAWNALYISLYQKAREVGMPFTDAWSKVHVLCVDHLMHGDTARAIAQFNGSGIAHAAFMELQAHADAAPKA